MHTPLARLLRRSKHDLASWPARALVLVLACASTSLGAACRSAPESTRVSPADPSSVDRETTDAPSAAAQDVERARRREEARRFLDEHMPERDRGKLSAELLAANLDYALRAREEFPWSSSVPEELWLNDVLPYAVLDEVRESWRPAMFELASTIVAGARTASEAAQRLNRDLFGRIGVHYDTRRAKPNQNVSESRASGMASCTGLSIALVEACRAVGIPARAVGTPNWATKPGNHTWVEVWDGDWHFLGADEYDAEGLDRGWFRADAAAARPELARHRIYATSWKRTGLSFPLVWNVGDTDVAAVDVTERYTRGRPAEGAGPVVTWVRVVRTRGGERVAAALDLLDEDGRVIASDRSRAGTADANDMAGFVVPAAGSCRLRVRFERRAIEVDMRALGRDALAAPNGSRVIDVAWDEFAGRAPAAQGSGSERATTEHVATGSSTSGTSSATSDENSGSTPTAAGSASNDGVDSAEKATSPALAAVRAWISADPASRGDAPSDPLTRAEAGVARAWLVEFRRGELAVERADETRSRAITIESRTLRWNETTFGSAPEGKRSLWISMHGGGGAPSEVNDRQWKNQGGLYVLEEGIYVTPRAPTDTWNLWHEAHVDGLFDRLIEDFVALRGVDPERVYLLGYSAGGDGVWQLAPRMADRFAAAAMMAGHPNEASLVGLRNLPFAILMGGDDAAYDRNKVASERAEALDQLRAGDPDGYEHFVRIYPGLGHWMDRKDAEALPWLAQHARRTWPKRIAWYQDDVVHDSLYWLERPMGAAKSGERLDAVVAGNTIRVTTNGTPLAHLTLALSDDLVDLDAPVTVEVDGRVAHTGSVQRTAAALLASLRARFDPTRAAAARLAW